MTKHQKLPINDFFKNKHIAKDLFDEKFVKMWEMYLAVLGSF